MSADPLFADYSKKIYQQQSSPISTLTTTIPIPASTGTYCSPSVRKPSPGKW